MANTVEVSVDDLTRTLMLLDAAQEALDAAASREKAREAGKSMRCITAQQRAAATRNHVAKMAAAYGIDVD